MTKLVSISLKILPILFFLAALTFLVIYGNSKKQKLIPKTTASPQISILSPEAEKISRLAPIKFDFGIVVYYPEDQSFAVIIVDSDFAANKEKAAQWFVQNGVADICTIKLEFRKNSARDPITEEERLPTGCPPAPPS